MQKSFAPTFGDKWELDRDLLILSHVLGRGNYGVVYYGIYHDAGKNTSAKVEVAIKTVQGNSLDELVQILSQSVQVTQFYKLCTVNSAVKSSSLTCPTGKSQHCLA